MLSLKPISFASSLFALTEVNDMSFCNSLSGPRTVQPTLQQFLDLMLSVRRYDNGDLGDKYFFASDYLLYRSLITWHGKASQWSAWGKHLLQFKS
jgi:hypothetical protein